MTFIKHLKLWMEQSSFQFSVPFNENYNFFAFGIKLPGGRMENGVDLERTEGVGGNFSFPCRTEKRKICPIRRNHSTSEGRDGWFWKKNSVSILAPKKFLHTTAAENKSFTHEQEKKNATWGKISCIHMSREKWEGCFFFKGKSYFSSLKSQTLLSQISFGLNYNLRGVYQQHTLQSSVSRFQYS